MTKSAKSVKILLCRLENRTRSDFMKKTERITIRIESEKLKNLQAIANKKDIPVSALVRKILKEYILDKWKE